MIPNGTPYINYPPFANNGSKTPPGGSTESAKYALGMIPSDTFPAEWANYLFHGATEGVTRLNADAGSMKKEINNVLSEASITPDAQVNTQLFTAIKALANLTRTIISLTTSASERPAKSDVPFIPIVQDGLRISVKFTNGYYDAATNGFTFNLNNQGAKKIYAAKNGVLTEMRYHELTRDGVQRKWYVQPLTTLDLIYESTLDSGAGGWLVEGNPVVLSASSYTIYANGKIGSEETATVKSWPSDNIPYGWLLCDGRALQRADYPDLYAELGVRYNLSTDPSDVFRLPNYTNLTMTERQASSTEQFTGRYWTDGKPIYRKTYYSSNNWQPPSSSNPKIEIGTINDVDMCISMTPVSASIEGSGNYGYAQNQLASGSTANRNDAVLVINQTTHVATAIVFRQGVFVNNTPAHVTFEYTKITDTAGTVPPLNWIIKY